jgi:hypothetical protein
MSNPWLALPTIAPFVLAADAPAIRDFNAPANENTQIRLERWPEPFVGDPEAPVVLLNLNPGFHTSELEAQQDHSYMTAWRKNLRRDVPSDGFYLIAQALRGQPGHEWWIRHLRPIIGATSRERVMRAICCIEYFPYHSERWAFSGRVPSQDYSFALVEAAVRRGAMVVLMRSSRLWDEAVPSLRAYQDRCVLNSPQNPAISPGNCSAFEKIVNRIRGVG